MLYNCTNSLYLFTLSISYVLYYATPECIFYNNINYYRDNNLYC